MYVRDEEFTLKPMKMTHLGDFKAILLDIDAHLDSKDLELLKFLCKDVVSFSVLGKCQRCLDVFANLEQKGKLKEENSKYLQECFHYMQRKDLIRKLSGDPQQLENRIRANGPNYLTEFRILLFDIAEDCGKDELEKMKFYSRTTLHLPKKMVDKVKSCLDLFNVLEKEEKITNIDVNTLEQLIKTTGDEELLESVYQYKNRNLVSSPTDEMNVEPGMKLDLHINHFSNTTAAVTPQAHQGPEHNLAVQTEGSNPQMGAYPSLTSMNPPAQDAMDTIMPRQQSPAQSSEENLDSHDDMFHYYKMTSKPRGYCVIINNQIFHGNLGERKGTDIDEEKLKDVFGNHLEFRVEVYRNATSEEIMRVCQEYSRKNHRQFDCLVFCILSHGSTGAVYGTDSNSVRIKDITACFTASRCPSLAEKPKLFFFQACQGLSHQSGLQTIGTTRNVDPNTQMDATQEPPRSEVNPNNDRTSSAHKMIPDESDFLLGYATVPGYVSYRSRSQGSFYINILAEKLKKYALGPRGHDLVSILVSVNQAVSELHYSNEDGHMFKQVPAPQFTLRRSVQFDKC